MQKTTFHKKLKKEQFENYIKKINKLVLLISFIILLSIVLIHFLAGSEKMEPYTIQIFNTAIILLVLTHLKGINLKQRAIIRYITDSISDNEI